MKQTLILCEPNPLYVCKRNADCKGTRKTKHCSKECFYTLDKKLAIEPNAYYACINPFDEEGEIMLIREDKLKNFNLMTREEAIIRIKGLYGNGYAEQEQALDMAIKALEQQPILDKIRAEIIEEKDCAYADFEEYKVEYLGQDREDVEDSLPQDDFRYGMERCIEIIDKYKTKTEKCKDCKWWKDSDGIYRRGCRAESKCPINRKEVLEGNGYCYMFEPQESEKKE